jgi:tmRNA-binding protein
MNKHDVLFLVETMYPGKPLTWIKRKDMLDNLYLEFQQSLGTLENDKVCEEVSCKTNKTITTTHVNKDRTRSVLISSYNCGIINGYRELYGSESIRQVTLYYCDLIGNAACELSEFFIYDEACHLLKYLKDNKINETTSRDKKLCTKRHYVDKLHIKNHTDNWCLYNCDPNKVPELSELNTVVCEQINFWLSRFKYIVKHMNFVRYQFFLFNILSMHNREKSRNQNHQRFITLVEKTLIQNKCKHL